MEMTDEQMNRVNRALKGEAVELSDEEAKMVEDSWKLSRPKSDLDTAYDVASKTASNLGTMGSKFAESISQVPGGVAKLVSGEVPISDVAAELSLEALPLAPVVGETVAGLAGIGGAAYGAGKEVGKAALTGLARLAGIGGEGKAAPTLQDISESAVTSGNEAMNYVRQAREQRLAEIDPEVRAALNLGAAATPMGLASTAVEMAVPTAQRALSGQGTDTDVAADILSTGVAAGIPMVAGKTLKGAAKVTKAAGRELSELPGRLRGVSKEALTEYLADPTAVKAGSVGREAKRSLLTVGDIRDQLGKSQAKQADLEAQLNEAVSTYSSDKDLIARQLQDAKLEVSGLEDAYRKQAMSEQGDLKKEQLAAKYVVGDETRAWKYANTAREAEITSIKDSLKNPSPELVAEVENKLELLKENTAQAAKDQIDFIKTNKNDVELDSGIIFDAVRQFRDEAQIRGVDTMKAAPITAFLNKWEFLGKEGAAPLDAWEAVKLRQDIDGMINYDLKTGQYGGMARSALSGFRTKINKVLDNALVEYPKVRKTLEHLSDLQSESTKVIGKNIEGAISKLGSKGDARAMKAFQDLSEVSPTAGKTAALPGEGVVLGEVANNELSRLLSERMDAVSRLKQLERDPLRKGTPELEAARSAKAAIDRKIFETTLEKRMAERPTSEADVAAQERTSEQRMLDEYLVGLKKPIESQMAGVAGDIQTTQGRLDVLGSLEGRKLKEAGAEREWAAKKVRETPSHEGDSSWVEAMAKEQGREVGELSSAYRQARAKEAIYGQESPPFVSGNLSMGKVPIVRSALKSLGPAVTTIPLDVRRILNSTANSKWAKAFSDAYARTGDKGVAVTHFLLQQTDPEYNKAISEEE